MTPAPGPAAEFPAAAGPRNGAPLMSLAVSIHPDLPSAAAGDFAEAMSRLASGVVLVTTLRAGRPWGVTVTSFASVSADPPTVLVSLGRESAAAAAIRSTFCFGVSMLALDQVPVARRGSLAGAAKFLDDCDGDRFDGGSPFVEGASAHLDCVLIDAMPVADHVVLIGRVTGAHTSSTDRAPLIYHRRDYRSLASEGRPPCRSN